MMHSQIDDADDLGSFVCLVFVWEQCKAGGRRPHVDEQFTSGDNSESGTVDAAAQCQRSTHRRTEILHVQIITNYSIRWFFESCS